MAKKKKKKTAGSIITNIILVIAIVCFIGSGAYLVKYYWTGMQAEKKIDGLRDLIVEESKPAVIDEETPESEAAPWTKYDKLYEQNEDLVGWITIENTNIDYPVMHTPKDPEFYLYRNFEKEYEAAGLPFVDYRCTINPASTNVIIYAHHMKNGSMFSDLVNYEKQSFYVDHPTITFDTIYGPGEYEIFAVILSKAYDINDDVFKYYDFVEAYTEDEFNEYIDNIRSLQLYDTGVEVEYGDQMITLSTCEYSQEDGRFAVLAKKIN